MSKANSKITQDYPTSPRMRAIEFLAIGFLSAEEVADKCEITRKTLYNWRQQPSFQESISSRRQELHAAIRTEGVAILENRVNRLNTDWKDLQAVKARRGEKAQQYADEEGEEEYPGMTTGLIVRVETPVKNGVKVEYMVDNGLLGELRAIEMQAAKELGQWTERQDVTSAGKSLASDMSEETLDEQIESLKNRKTAKALPRFP